MHCTVHGMLELNGQTIKTMQLTIGDSNFELIEKGEDGLR